MRWLGIDGGGTKTAFTVYDEHMKRIDRLVLPTCHYAQVGIDGAIDVLHRGVAWALGGACAQTPLGIGFSICGYGENPVADDALRRCAASLADGRPYVVVNDVEAAWAAGLEMADGVALISGTGSIALGVHGERRVRCGGWDYEIGDEGSAGWMGKELLRAFTRQCDGRDRRGPLHGIVRRALALENDYAIIPFAHTAMGDRGTIAGLSPLVTEAALAGDASAHDIFARAAQEEAAMVRAIVDVLFTDRSRDPIPVTYIGGTFSAGELILQPLAKALPPSCRLVAPKHEPDLGPVLILRSLLDRMA